MAFKMNNDEMGIAINASTLVSSLNSLSGHTFLNVDTSNFITDENGAILYFTLSDLYNENGSEKVYPLCGIYQSTAGEYGPHPVAALEDRYVNLPQHLNSAYDEIMGNQSNIELINMGYLGFKIYSYKSPRRKEMLYSISWVQLNPDE